MGIAREIEKGMATLKSRKYPPIFKKGTRITIIILTLTQLLSYYSGWLDKAILGCKYTTSSCQNS